jgi:hypothetical protein
MQPLLSYLLTGALFVHAALGCCWHQGRDCEHCGVAKLSEPASNCPSDYQEHEQCPGPCQSGPCKCRLNCQDTCKAVAPEKTVLAKSHSVAAFDAVAAVLSCTAVACTPSDIRQTVFELAGSRGLLRPHLLHQILLI